MKNIYLKKNNLLLNILNTIISFIINLHRTLKKFSRILITLLRYFFVITNLFDDF